MRTIYTLQLEEGSESTRLMIESLIKTLGIKAQRESFKMSNKEIIATVVKKHYKNDPRKKGLPKKSEYVEGRQVAHALAYRNKNIKDSLASIGSYFGGKDHATVLNSNKKVKNYCETDKKYREKFNAVEREVEREINMNIGESLNKLFNVKINPEEIISNYHNARPIINAISEVCNRRDNIINKLTETKDYEKDVVNLFNHKLEIYQACLDRLYLRYMNLIFNK